MKILAADDEQLALEQLVKTIKDVDSYAQIDAFNNPRLLLEHAKGKKYDVAFLDIEMGAISGIEVAKQLKIWYPKINIVFVTAYSEYMADAFKLRVSGYVCKPISKKDIIEELEGLRTPVMPEKNNILVAKCFGNFDVYVNGKSLKFERSKTKEMLAYLIDRRGSTVTSGELRSVLWEDESNNKSLGSYFQKLKKDLINVLKSEGIDDILITSWNKYAIRPEKISCDYYDYLDNKYEGIHAYNGEYMTQYSWGEIKNVILKDNKKIY